LKSAPSIETVAPLEHPAEVRAPSPTGRSQALNPISLIS